MLFGKSSRFQYNSKKIEDGERLVALPTLDAHPISTANTKNSELLMKKGNGLRRIKNLSNSPIQENFSVDESDENSVKVYVSKNALKAILSPRVNRKFQNPFKNEESPCIDDTSSNQIVIPTAPMEHTKMVKNSFAHKNRQIRSSFPNYQHLVAIDSIRPKDDISTLQSYLDSIRESEHHRISTEPRIVKSFGKSILGIKTDRVNQHADIELIKSFEDHCQKCDAHMLTIGGSSYSLKPHSETSNGISMRNRIETKGISKESMMQASKDTNKWTSPDSMKEVSIQIPESIVAQNADSSFLLQRHLEYYQSFQLNGLLFSKPASPPAARVPDFKNCDIPKDDGFRISECKELSIHLIQMAIVNATDNVQSIVDAKKDVSADGKEILSLSVIAPAS